MKSSLNSWHFAAMKNAADLSAADVAPTSGTGGTLDGIGWFSTTPDALVGYIDSR